MWGLSLRHGWGVEKDEAKAFRWLKKAAEHAVVDLKAVNGEGVGTASGLGLGASMVGTGDKGEGKEAVRVSGPS